MTQQTSIDVFQQIDMRVGTIISVTVSGKTIKPAYRMQIDFGPAIGILKSSAQITALYKPEDLAGKQVIAVVNFPPRQIADFMSECLVLGLTGGDSGIVLLQPERPVPNGGKVA